MLPLFFMALELLVGTLWRFVLVGDQFAGKLEAEDLLIGLQIFNADLVALGAPGTSCPRHAKLRLLQTILHAHNVPSRKGGAKARQPCAMRTYIEGVGQLHKGIAIGIRPPDAQGQDHLGARVLALTHGIFRRAGGRKVDSSFIGGGRQITNVSKRQHLQAAGTHLQPLRRTARYLGL